jgi:hypothetical protein
LGCTIPHHCCCGRCGPSCGHNHLPVANAVCFYEGEITHKENNLYPIQRAL